MKKYLNKIILTIIFILGIVNCKQIDKNNKKNLTDNIRKKYNDTLDIYYNGYIISNNFHLKDSGIHVFRNYLNHDTGKSYFGWSGKIYKNENKILFKPFGSVNSIDYFNFSMTEYDTINFCFNNIPDTNYFYIRDTQFVRFKLILESKKYNFLLNDTTFQFKFISDKTIDKSKLDYNFLINKNMVLYGLYTSHYIYETNTIDIENRVGYIDLDNHRGYVKYVFNNNRL